MTDPSPDPARPPREGDTAHLPAANEPAAGPPAAEYTESAAPPPPPPATAPAGVAPPPPRRERFRRGGAFPLLLAGLVGAFIGAIAMCGLGALIFVVGTWHHGDGPVLRDRGGYVDRYDRGGPDQRGPRGDRMPPPGWGDRNTVPAPPVPPLPTVPPTPAPSPS